MVNITKLTKKMADDAGLFIEHNMHTFEDSGETVDTVIIGEECSDFYIEYYYDSGILNRLVSPDYIDCPETIIRSVQLRDLMKVAVKFIEDDDH